MIKKKKLCFAINQYDSLTDSHYRYCYELIESLDDEVEVFGLFEKKHSPITLKIKNYYVCKLNNSFLRCFEIFFVLSYLRLKGYTHFYSHYTVCSRLVMPLIARLTFAKSYHWHCGIFKLFKSKGKISKKKIKDKLFNEFPEELSWKLNHYLVTGNKTLQEHYHKDFALAKEKILILRNWISEEYFSKVQEQELNKIRKKLNIKPEDKILLFVHRIAKRKGAQHIIPSYELLQKRKRKVKIIVIGDGPELKNLKKITKRKGIAKNILFLGKVPNKELSLYFKISTLFFMPSEEEGFPHVLLESLLMELPYVASDIGGVKEISPPELQKFIVPVGDIESYVTKIEELLRDNNFPKKKLKQYVIENYNKELAKKEFIENLK